MPISLISILIICSHLRLGLPKGSFLQLYLLKFWKHSNHLPFWLHDLSISLLDLITLLILGERYKLWSSSLWSLLHSPFLSLLGPNIRLRILFSNTLSLDSSLNVRDHVSQPYSTTDNVIVLYIFKVTHTLRKYVEGGKHGGTALTTVSCCVPLTRRVWDQSVNPSVSRSYSGMRGDHLPRPMTQIVQFY